MEKDSPPDEFLCPITQDVMLHPVMDHEGHSFEHKAILNWLLVNTKCPIGRENIARTELSPNRALRSLIDKWNSQVGRDVSHLTDELLEEESKLKAKLEEMDAKGIVPKFVAPPPQTPPPPSAFRGRPPVGMPLSGTFTRTKIVSSPSVRVVVNRTVNPPPPSRPIVHTHVASTFVPQNIVANNPTANTHNAKPPNGPRPPSTKRSEPSAPPSPRKVVQYVKALYDYTAQTEKDLSFKEGDQVRVIDRSNPTGWWEGELNGVTGFFPSTFVEVEERIFYVTAIFDFNGESEKDLSFNVGDRIKVTDNTNPSGWWKGELSNGQSGFFPCNFVETERQ